MSIKRLAKRAFSRLLPVPVKSQLSNFYILAVKYGQFRTIRRWECVDSVEALIPWYTYPAIEYLNNLDFSDKVVFEYGSGNSSTYWAGKAKVVHSVEHDKSWFEKIKNTAGANQVIELCESEQGYLAAIGTMAGKADVIIIDGVYREQCAKLVAAHLAEGGMVILDNADWYKETSRYLRETLDLIEVDFHGFGPINAYTWTTSIFFTRTARFQAVNKVQPHYSMAALQHGDDEKFN